MINIHNLEKYYGKKCVLSEVDFHFEKGKVYGIIGRNGAGKTTLFKCLTGLESYKGTIQSDWDSLKDVTGVLWTEPYFFSRMTGREYLCLILRARGIEPFDFEEQNVFDLPLDEYAATYSTGMKKKLALWAILLQENQVYILDEPFSGVDIQSNLLIVEIIKKLRDKGCTILISSHIFSTLSEVCDEIGLLDQGGVKDRFLPYQFLELEEVMRRSSIGDKLERLKF